MFTKNHLKEINGLRLTLKEPSQALDFIKGALADFDQIYKQSDEKQEIALKAWLVNYYQKAPEAAKAYIAPLALTIAYQLAVGEVDAGQFDDFIVRRALKLLFSKSDRLAILPGEITAEQFLAQDYLQFGTSKYPIIVPWPHAIHKKKEPSILMLRSLAAQDLENAIKGIEQQYGNQASSSTINIAKNHTETSAQEIITKLKKMMTEGNISPDAIKAFIKSLNHRYSKTGFTGEPHSPANILCAQLVWLCVDKNSENPQKDFWAILYPELKQVYDGEQNTGFPPYGQAVLDNTVVAGKEPGLIHYGKIHALAQTQKGYEKIKNELSINTFKQVAKFYPGHGDFWKTGEVPVIKYGNYADFFKALLEYLQSYIVGKGGSSEYDVSLTAMDKLEKDYAPYLRYLIHYLDFLSEADRIRFEKATTAIDKVGNLGEVRLIAIVRVLLNPPSSSETTSCFNLNQIRLAFLLTTKAASAIDIKINPSLFVERALPDSGSQALPYGSEPDSADKKLDRESLIDAINNNDKPNFAKYALDYGLTRTEEHKAKNLLNLVFLLQQEKRMPFLQALLGEALDFSLLIFHDRDEYLVFANKIRELENHIPEDVIQKGIDKAPMQGLLPLDIGVLHDKLFAGVSIETTISLIPSESAPPIKDFNILTLFAISVFFKNEDDFNKLLKYYAPSINYTLHKFTRDGFGEQEVRKIILRLKRAQRLIFYTETSARLNYDDFDGLLELPFVYNEKIKTLIHTKICGDVIATERKEKLHIFTDIFIFLAKNNQSSQDFEKVIHFSSPIIHNLSKEDYIHYYIILDKLNNDQRVILLKAITSALIEKESLNEIMSLAHRHPLTNFYSSDIIKLITTPKEYEALEQAFTLSSSTIRADFVHNKLVIPLSFFNKLPDVIYNFPGRDLTEVGEAHWIPSSDNFTLNEFARIAQGLTPEQFTKFAEYYGIDLKRHLTAATFKWFLQSLRPEQRMQVLVPIKNKLNILLFSMENIVNIAPLFANTEQLPNNESDFFDFLKTCTALNDARSAIDWIDDFTTQETFNMLYFKSIPDELFESFLYYYDKNLINALTEEQIVQILQSVTNRKISLFSQNCDQSIKKLSQENIMLLINDLPQENAQIISQFCKLSLVNIAALLRNNTTPILAKIHPMLINYSANDLKAEIRMLLKNPDEFASITICLKLDNTFHRRVIDSTGSVLNEAIKIFFLLLSEKPLGRKRHEASLQMIPQDNYGYLSFGYGEQKEKAILRVLQLSASDPLFKTALDLACIPDGNERIKQTYMAAYNQHPFARSTRGATSNPLRFSNTSGELNLTDTPEPGSRLAKVVEAIKGPRS